MRRLRCLLPHPLHCRLPAAQVWLCCMQNALEVVLLEDGGVQRRMPLDSALMEASAALRNRDLDRCVHKCIAVKIHAAVLPTLWLQIRATSLMARASMCTRCCIDPCLLLNASNLSAGP